MAPEDEVNQDALAAEWGVALEQETAVPAGSAAPRAPSPNRRRSGASSRSR